MSSDLSSPFLRKCKKHITRMDGRALDLPCGTGRNLATLRSYGYFVISADVDHHTFFTSGLSDSEAQANFLRLDGFKPLPFADEIFDLVAVIHPPHHSMAINAMHHVRAGGYLLFESFGLQGNNWKSLPHRGEMLSLLSHEFDAILYDEQAAKKNPEMVSVRALMRRTSPRPIE